MTASTKKTFDVKPGYCVPFNDAFALILSIEGDVVTYCQFPYYAARTVRIQMQYLQFGIQAGVKKEVSRFGWMENNGGLPVWASELKEWIENGTEMKTTTPEDYKPFIVEVRPTEAFKAAHTEDEFWYYCESKGGGCSGTDDNRVSINAVRKMDLAGVIADPFFEIISMVAEHPRQIRD